MRDLYNSTLLGTHVMYGRIRRGPYTLAGGGGVGRRAGVVSPRSFIVCNGYISEPLVSAANLTAYRSHPTDLLTDRPTNQSIDRSIFARVLLVFFFFNVHRLIFSGEIKPQKKNSWTTRRRFTSTWPTTASSCGSAATSFTARTASG